MKGAFPTVGGTRGKRAVIQVYHGLGTETLAEVWGRVLVDRGDRMPHNKERWYRKLRRNLKALDSDEIPHAKLELAVLGRRYPVKADKEGRFTVRLRGPLPVGTHRVTARLSGSRRYRVEHGVVMVWPSKAGVAVISDIDDTVLQTGVKKKIKMALRILTTNARDLKTYVRAPVLFRVWAARGYPIAFVSGSPINLVLRLRRFFAIKRFPVAPMLLKDFGVSGKFGFSFQQKAYKLHHFATVFRLLPGYRLLLVGDSGEQDPEVYRAVAQKYPGRVMATMIHRVTPEKPTAKRFEGQILFDSYLDLARGLHQRRLLTAKEWTRIEKDQ